MASALEPKAGSDQRPGTKGQLQRIPFGAPADEVEALCRRDGGVILTGVLSRDEVARVNLDLDRAMNPVKLGNFSDGDHNYLADFMGTKTKRLVHVVKHSETYRERILDNDKLFEYVARIVPGREGMHSLFASHAIEIFPGETAQPLHRDSGGFDQLLGTDHRDAPNLIANTLLALTDVTEEMGATRVVPGSQLWDDFSVIPPQEDTVPALLGAGDMLFFTGKTIHGGGANVTADQSRRVISTVFSVPFFIGEEAWPFALSIDEVKSYPPRLQTILGFRSISYHDEDPGLLWRVETRPLQERLGL